MCCRNSVLVAQYLHSNLAIQHESRLERNAGWFMYGKSRKICLKQEIEYMRSHDSPLLST